MATGPLHRGVAACCHLGSPDCAVLGGKGVRTSLWPQCMWTALRQVTSCAATASQHLSISVVTRCLQTSSTPSVPPWSLLPRGQRGLSEFKCIIPPLPQLPSQNPPPGVLCSNCSGLCTGPRMCQEGSCPWAFAPAPPYLAFSLTSFHLFSTFSARPSLTPAV